MIESAHSAFVSEGEFGTQSAFVQIVGETYTVRKVLKKLKELGCEPYHQSNINISLDLVLIVDEARLGEKRDEFRDFVTELSKGPEGIYFWVRRLPITIHVGL